MSYWILMSTLLAAALGYAWFYRRTASASPLPAASHAPRGAPAPDAGLGITFAGFQVVVEGEGCDAARALIGVTFSARDRFALPLAECSNRDCRCRKRAVSERRQYHRRQGGDRRELVRFGVQNSDRRKGAGRRAGEQLWHGGYR